MLRRFFIWVGVEFVVVAAATFIDAFVWAWYPLAFYLIAINLWVGGMLYTLRPFSSGEKPSDG